ncbi:MAG: UDP-N-acetylmuramoyl-tripeptide--D-alanyl-D-alanine ligase [Spirochaetes bacterium]|nr:UDP-N-acetylmuramoyl-tripeptide--D-alanyl-D-alanine ligase [Spirochaetota bacterium]
MFAPIDYDLFTIAAVCTEGRAQINLPQTRLHSITTSSLEAKPGSLFVPLVDRRDGHEFIADALKRGASAFFAKHNHPILKAVTADERSKAIIVQDPLLALGALAGFHRRRFAPLVIGVTGSNGKTTTKEMLAQIFRAHLGRALLATEKNYNNHIGVPFTLLGIDKKTRTAVVEMGMNHAGEIAYLSRLTAPHAALISSVGHAHIEFFKSRAGIASAKGEILTGMPAGSTLYIPHSIAELATFMRLAKKHKTNLRRIDLCKGLLKIKHESATGFTLAIGAEKILFPYANRVWVSNLALAAEAAHDAGVPTATIAVAARNFKPAAGRMQLKRGYLTIIDDGYNANPDSAVASIDSAMQIAAGKPVVCVFGDFKELGKFSTQLHSWTGVEAAKKGVAAFYGVGRDMRHARAAFQRTAKKSARSFAFAREDVDALIAALREEAKGSVILVKGSRSMKMEEIVEALLSLQSDSVAFAKTYADAT